MTNYANDEHFPRVPTETELYGIFDGRYSNQKITLRQNLFYFIKQLKELLIGISKNTNKKFSKHTFIACKRLVSQLELITKYYLIGLSRGLSPNDALNFTAIHKRIAEIKSIEPLFENQQIYNFFIKMQKVYCGHMLDNFLISMEKQPIILEYKNFKMSSKNASEFVNNDENSQEYFNNPKYFDFLLTMVKYLKEFNNNFFEHIVNLHCNKNDNQK